MVWTERGLVGVVAAILLVACQASGDGDVGRATDALTLGDNVEVSVGPSHPDALDRGLQSEQSVVRTIGPGGEPLLVVGYNDTTNMVEEDGSFGPEFSFMGWAISHDDGDSWEPQPQFDLPPGLDGLRGDPWLATNAEHTEVWYAFLGVVDGGGRNAPTALAWAYSPDGGLNWEEVRFVDLGYRIDKPSLAVSAEGTKLYAAYINEGTEDVEVLVSRTGGDDWEAPTVIPDASSIRRNPIIRRAPLWDDVLYVSFQEGSGDIRFAGSTNDAQHFEVWSTPVSGAAVFRPNGQEGVDIRNLVFHSFYVDPESLHCDIVYEDNFAIYFTSSLDGTTWSAPVAVSDAAGMHQFQASIVANKDRVVVTYYEQDPSDALTDVVAVSSPDHGMSWDPPETLTQSSPDGEAPFVPCATDFGYFGDYAGLTSFDLDLEEEVQDPRFVALWADSRRGCDLWGPDLTARHQHTVGAWFSW